MKHSPGKRWALIQGHLTRNEERLLSEMNIITRLGLPLHALLDEAQPACIVPGVPASRHEPARVGDQLRPIGLREMHDVSALGCKALARGKR